MGRNSSGSGCGSFLGSIGSVLFFIIFMVQGVGLFQGCIKIVSNLVDAIPVTRIAPNPAPNKQFDIDLSKFTPSEFNKLIAKLDGLDGLDNIENLIQAKYELNINFLTVFFGENSMIVTEYEEAFNKTGDLIKARELLIPKELQEIPNLDYEIKAELYGLFKGLKLNGEQAKALTAITKTYIMPTHSRFNDYIILEPKSDKRFKIFSTQVIKEVSENNLFSEINIGSEMKIIFKGDVTKTFIDQCNEKGISIIYHFDSFLKNLSISSENIKFIYVASKDKTQLRSLFDPKGKYDESAIVSLLSTVKQLDMNSYSEIVETEESLLKTVHKIKESGNVPIVVFNNLDNKLFNKEISDIGINDFITCNSFEIPNIDQSTITTNFIYFKELVQSIKEAKSISNIKGDEFWLNLATNYNAKIIKETDNDVHAKIVIGIGITGTGSCTIYYINNNNNK